VGHLETATLAECESEEGTLAALGDLTLFDVQALLENAIARAADD
jgi:hypothetical protein